MQIEFDPIVRGLDLARGDDAMWRATLGAIEIVALMTEIGMTPARRAARRALDLGVDTVAVVGIAGGLDPAIAIGQVIRPAVVIDRARATSHVPTWLDPAPVTGSLSSGDDFITDPAALLALRDAGAVAVDMETAAIGDECERAGVPWLVFRAISDRPDSGLIDAEIFAFTKSDGAADRDALREYLSADPGRAERLAQLARDTDLATNAAATAAINAITALDGAR